MAHHDTLIDTAVPGEAGEVTQFVEPSPPLTSPTILPEASPRQPPDLKVDLRQIGDTTALLAHELRTPLAAIVSSAELMSEERFGALGDPRYKGYAVGIMSAARHLLDVVELMLNGAAQSVPTADVATAVATAAEHVRSLAEANRATITLDTPPVRRLLIEPTALRQMLINLAANAVQHSGLEAVIVIRSGEGADGEVWIEVEDDGPGIPQAIADRLQAPNATSVTATSDTFAKGHGLGLAITTAIARKNGAELALITADPHGTRARLTFASA